MPLYLLKCPRCDFEDDVFLKIVDRDRFVHCPSCHTAMERKVSSPFIMAEIQAYESPNSGKMIQSRAQRREDLQRSHAIEWEPGIEKDIARTSEHLKKQAMIPIEKAVDEKVAAMVVAGRLET